MAIRVERHEHVAVVCIERPEALNAINSVDRAALRSAWDLVRADEKIWVAVLTGAGDKAFCAGNDLHNPPPEPEQFVAGYLAAGRESIIAGMDMTKPLIAAVNGYALGGGLELALACDIRICTPNAQFGAVEVKTGTMAAAGSTQRLPRIVPHAVAMQMLLTGDRLTADEALRSGLVTEIVPQERLRLRALELGARICQNGPLAVRATKFAATRGINMPLGEGMVLETLLWGLLRDTEDRREGRQAFIDKRPPRYKGR